MLNVAYTLGRICVPIVFIVSGFRKLFNVAGIAKMLADNNVPIPDTVIPYLSYVGQTDKYQALGYLVGGVEAIGGLMILLGFKARWGALMLVVFTAGTIFFVHHFWDMEGAAAAANQTQALKNLSILGALLLVVAHGSGSHAIDRRPVS